MDEDGSWQTDEEGWKKGRRMLSKGTKAGGSERSGNSRDEAREKKRRRGFFWEFFGDDKAKDSRGRTSRAREASERSSEQTRTEERWSED